MQAIYLIRHGEPAFKDGKCALGKLDLDLSQRGYECLALVKPALDSIPDKSIAVSPLIRARKSAEAAGVSEYKVYENLYELDLGLWDGLKFSEIKNKWPDEYERRGKDLSNFQTPGGENLQDCKKRVSTEFYKILKDYSVGSVIIFSHNAVAKMIMAHICEMNAGDAFKFDYKYGESIQLLLDDGKCIGKPYIGPVLHTPDTKTCLSLLDEAGTPDHVIDHSYAVAEKALAICKNINNAGFMLDERFVYAAALLHDLKRTEKKHAVAGARFLAERGYAALASTVGDHMDIPVEEVRISEKSLVFLADKLIKETSQVSLWDRYFKGKSKEQMEFSKVRYKTAESVFELYREFI